MGAPGQPLAGASEILGLTFTTKEAAVAYCENHRLAHHIVPAPPVRMKIQAYADNFR